MLMNEMQKQQQANAAQGAKIGELVRQVAELSDLKAQTQAALRTLRY